MSEYTMLDIVSLDQIFKSRPHTVFSFRKAVKIPLEQHLALSYCQESAFEPDRRTELEIRQVSLGDSFNQLQQNEAGDWLASRAGIGSELQNWS